MNNSPSAKEYTINIDPRILELLGPNLYTNIYYVLAELVANAYDAGAKNVYIVEKEDAIIVEDDGRGMSYSEGDINKYLNVAAETRTKEDEVYVDGTTRRKMGRKGVGKLAALSVSENVFVITRRNFEESGFILSRHINSDKKLEGLTAERIKFECISEEGNGTSIVMNNPQYDLHKTFEAIKKNLLKIFPIVSSLFQIHIVRDGQKITINDFDKEIIGELGALITLGDEYSHLTEFFDSSLDNKEILEKDLCKVEEVFSQEILMKNRYGEEKTYTMEIKGWIGSYRTTRGRKVDQTDFPDNFISILSNGKLGEFNILPQVGKNRLPEVYIVGQLHVDLLEETELPDISLSNRQGYKTDDPRYKNIINYVSNTLLPKIVDLRDKWADFSKVEREKGKMENERKEEEKLKESVKKYKTNTAENISKKLRSTFPQLSQEDTEKVIEEELDRNLPDMGLKRKIDSQKKQILISHTSDDKSLAEIIYNMLSFNGIDDELILYTSSSNPVCRVPQGAPVYDYLRDFFVDSISDQKIFVIYVTSDQMSQNWNAVLEVGACWITKSDHAIFNIRTHAPRQPLNTSLEWQSSYRVENNIEMDALDFDKFIEKILYICSVLGYQPKGKNINEIELKKYVTIRG